MLRLGPRSLFGQNLLLLLTLAMAAQVSTLTVYILTQRPRVVELGKLVAAQVNTLDSALAEIPAASRNDYIERISRSGPLVVHSGEAPSDQEVPPREILARMFIDTVHAQLKRDIDFRFRWQDDPRPEVWVHVNIGGERSWISLPVGVVLRYRWMTTALILSVCIAGFATIAALLMQRRINRPLRDIANAASKLGAGGRPERLPAYTATELNVVAEQFNAMSDSLEEMEATRAVMLAGISHDIRTPLTKLRLSLAMDSEASELPLSRYIDQIDAIVGQFLDFGRVGSDEALIEGNLNTLVQQIAGEFEDRDQPFKLVLGPLPPMRFRPVAMLRVICNLMENAVKYAGTGLEVRTWLEREQVHLAVLDRGPGLAPGEETRLLRPFIRANGVRAGVGGIGLGLAIVDRLARLHGGRLRLVQRRRGGLKACVVLPGSTIAAAPP